IAGGPWITLLIRGEILHVGTKMLKVSSGSGPPKSNSLCPETGGPTVKIYCAIGLTSSGHRRVKKHKASLWNPPMPFGFPVGQAPTQEPHWVETFQRQPLSFLMICFRAKKEIDP